MQPPKEKIKIKYTMGKPGKVIIADYFYYDTAPDYNHNLAIVCGGYEKCAPDFEINRSNYPYYFVKYTIGGKGTLEINSNASLLTPGTLTGFQPGTPHHYLSDPHDPLEHIFITFVGHQAAELFKKSTLDQSHVITTANSDEIFSLFQKMFYIGKTRPPYSQEICCNYLRILLLEQASIHSHSKKSASISMNTYQQAKKYIDIHFSTISSPSEVADKCSIDVRYMSSLFKRYCHIPPSQYLMRLKLNKAANLLLTTDLTVKEVAFQVGFVDQYHFSKNFKLFHGQSPQFFRRKHMQ